MAIELARYKKVVVSNATVRSNGRVRQDTHAGVHKNSEEGPRVKGIHIQYMWLRFCVHELDTLSNPTVCHFGRCVVGRRCEHGVAEFVHIGERTNHMKCAARIS